MTTNYIYKPKRSQTGIARLYDVSGLNYDVSGVLYQGAYEPTTWTFINKTS